MFNRHRGTPPISLFAFQDIITGVTGAMLILVLLLVGHARQTRRAETGALPAAVPADDGPAARIAVLEAEETALLRELDQRRTAVRQQHEEQARRQRIAALNAAQAELAKRRTALQRKLAQARAAAPEPAVPDSPGMAEYLKLRAEERSLIEEYRNRRNLLAIDPKRLEKPPLLLECRRAEWLLSRPGRTPETLGAGAPTLADALADLRRILKELGPEKYLLVIAARPAAGNYIAMLTRLLRREFPTLEMAVEPLGSDQSESPRIL